VVGSEVGALGAVVDSLVHRLYRHHQREAGRLGALWEQCKHFMAVSPTVYLQKDIKTRWAACLTGLFRTGTSSFWGKASRSAEAHAEYVAGYVHARFGQEQAAAEFEREKAKAAAKKGLRGRERAVRKGQPEWIPCGPKWTQNGNGWRSRAYADFGANGPATNVLEEHGGCWNTGGMGKAGEWIRIDTQTPYTMSRFRVACHAGIPESPKYCCLYALYRAGGAKWVPVLQFTWKHDQSVTEVDFPSAHTCQDFKFEVASTYGSDEGDPGAGACVNYITFFGAKDRAAASLGQKYESLGISGEWAPGRGWA